MSTRKRQLVVTHVFKGERFADHGIELSALPELLAYKEILVETAKELWRRRNPGRKRIPRNFEDAFSLKFYGLEPGSTAVPLYREIEVPEGGELVDYRDELDDAVDAVEEFVDAAEQDVMLPERFPANVIPLFDNYGKTLREDEHFEHKRPGKQRTVKYTCTARTRLLELPTADYEDAVVVIGTVTMARVTRPRMALALPDGREVEAVFPPRDESTIITALKEHATAKVKVTGRGTFSALGELKRIDLVDEVMLLPEGTDSVDAQAPPIWEVFEEIMADTPEEELAKLDRDAAAQLDHYVYGAEKR